MTIDSRLSPARPPVSRWLIPLLAIAFACAMAVFSRGYLEADEITHFLFARAVWHDWRHLVQIWGRLGATGLYALAAPLGPVGPRLLAVGVTSLTAWGACRLLRHFLPPTPAGFFRRHATAFTWLLLFAQPCFLLNSYAMMTEMLLACAWVWALVALVRGRHVLLAGMLLGLGGLMRPEGWIAIAAWPVFLFLLRRFAPSPQRPFAAPAILLSSALAALPVLAWYLLGVLAKHNWSWVAQSWPWQLASPYGRSGGFFLISSVTALALWMWLPVLRGVWSCWKNRAASSEALLVLVLPAAGFFLLHGTLGALGLFGSLSLPRYFIAVAPLLAILALLGLMQFEPRAGKWLPSTVVALSLIPLAVLIALGYLPMRPALEQDRLEVVVQAFRTRGIAVNRLIGSHPYIMLRLNLDPDSPGHIYDYSSQTITAQPPGSIIVSDGTLWVNEGRPSADQLKAWGFHEDPAVAAAVDAIPDRFEPLTFIAPNPSGIKVRLWIKE